MQNHPSDKIKFEIFSNFSLLPIYLIFWVQSQFQLDWIISQNLTKKNILIICRHQTTELMRGGNGSELGDLPPQLTRMEHSRSETRIW